MIMINDYNDNLIVTMTGPCDYPIIHNIAKTIQTATYSKWIIIQSSNATFPTNYLLHEPDAGNLALAYSNIQSNCAQYGPFSIVQQTFRCDPCSYPDYCAPCNCPWQLVTEDCCDCCQKWLSRPLNATPSPSYEHCMLTQLRQQSIYTANNIASIGDGIKSVIDKTLSDNNMAINWNTIAISSAIIGIAISAGVVAYVIRRRKSRIDDEQV